MVQSKQDVVAILNENLDRIKAFVSFNISKIKRVRESTGFQEITLTRTEQVATSEIGGFLTLSSPHAAGLQQSLRQRGVRCDARDDALRLGPAPYLSDQR